MTTQEIIERLAWAALEHGTPYVWGGNDPFNQTKYNGEMVGPGVDCSGFIVWLFKGLIKGDMTADDMWKNSRHYDNPHGYGYGNCVFYGENGKADHVMLYLATSIDSYLVIGSCGNAGVCVRPVNYRKDFLGFAAPRG